MDTPAPPPFTDWNWLRWLPGRGREWHQHDFLQFIHIIEGELAVDWGDGWRPCRSGDVHILPPHHAHRLATDVGYAQFGLNWRPQPDARGLLDAFNALDLRPGIWHVPGAVETVEVLRGSASQVDAIARARVGVALDTYAIRVYDALRRYTLGPWDLVVCHLEANLDRTVRVEAVARAARRSRAQVQRLCRDRCGHGLVREHARRRIAAAGRLLSTGEDSIAVVATRLGYADQAQFSRAFKRVTGMTPTAYRHGHRPCV